MVLWIFANLHNSASTLSCFVDIAQKSRNTVKTFSAGRQTVSLSIHLKRNTLNCKETWVRQEAGAYIKLRKMNKHDQITNH